MRKSIRKLVGVGAGAIGFGFALTLIVAPQLAAASPTTSHVHVSGGLASFSSNSQLLKSLTISEHKAIVKKTVVKAAITPSASCTAAKADLSAAKAKDAAEDTAEKTNGTESPAEDAAERAAIKPLFDAFVKACGFTRPAPSAACVSAMNAFKAWIAKDRVEDAAEKTNGTESPAEDAAEKAEVAPLFQAIKTACGFGNFFHR
jgi:hypothetical protein